MSGQRTDDEPVVYYSTASVVRASGSNEATPDELMKLILKHAKDPTIFTKDGVTPFTWMAQVSNSKLDSYFTRQDNQSLKNYKNDATDGVMFLDSHDKRQLGFGQSIRGVFTPASGKLDEKNPDDNDPATLDVDFYTIPGVQLGRASSDSFIAGVRSGIIHDVSIGFMPESFECNLCRADPFDWWNMECRHIPGAYYDSTGEHIVTKKSQGAMLAFAWVRNSRLLEVSAVYDGATPGAYVKKAQWLAEAGEVDRAAAGILERQLRIHLPEQAMNIPVLKLNQQAGTVTVSRGSAIIDGVRYNDGAEVEPMRFRRLSEERGQPDEAENTNGGAGGDEGDPTPSPPSENPNLKREETPESIAATSGGITSPAHAAPEDVRMNGLTDEQLNQLQEQAARDADIVKRARRALGVFGLKDAETADIENAIVGLSQEITELRPRAEMGDEWRKQEIERALESGVRAMDKDFKRDEWTSTFEHMPVRQIQLLAETWERQAPDLSGGRRTTDVKNDPPAGGEKKSTTAPAAQYAVNGRR